MKYRPEIDGLRAVAVVPVLLYHAGFRGFGGGYVGVDVFFVISGYLITSVIIDERRAGVFSLAGFYERRVRRILPALFLMMAICTPIAWLILLPRALEGYSQSVAAIPVFSSNILFWSQSGYFDAATELKPLIHTWSLAVEEQFYLLYPLFLVGTWREKRRWTHFLMLVPALASLLLAFRGATHAPSMTFFLLPTRVWELLAGGVLASCTTARPANHLLRQYGSMLGLLLIGGAVLTMVPSTPFASLMSLAPTVGATLVVHCATPDTVAGRFLGSRLLVGIGKISYSAYLWHQPLLSFLRHSTPGRVGITSLVVVLLATLAVAYLSWRFVEQPFRQRERVGLRGIAVMSIGGGAIFLAVGLLGKAAEGFRSRLPPNVKWESFGERVEREGPLCSSEPLQGYPGVYACEFGDKQASRRVVLYGDSHADAIGPELDRQFLARNIRGVRVYVEGCYPIPRVHSAKTPGPWRGCDKPFESLLSYISAQGADVVVLSRWTFRLYPIPGEIDQLTFDSPEGGVEHEKYVEFAAENPMGGFDFGSDVKRAAVRHFLSGLTSTKRRIYLVHPVPEVGWDIARLNWNGYRSSGTVPSSISVPYEAFKLRNRFIESVFSEFRDTANLVSVRPEEVLCGVPTTERCAAQLEGQPLYLDDDHLSDLGARRVVDLIFQSGL
jgi:peptidoglycan/LPS O-acetylase OafA/YrhL